jgi:phage FluMu protein Com
MGSGAALVAVAARTRSAVDVGDRRHADQAEKCPRCGGVHRTVARREAHRAVGRSAHRGQRMNVIVLVLLILLILIVLGYGGALWLVVPAVIGC